MTSTNVTELKAVEKPQNYSIEITMNDDAVHNFVNILGYQVNGDWVAVSLTDGSTYAYPAARVTRIKHYITKEAE